MNAEPADRCRKIAIVGLGGTIAMAPSGAGLRPSLSIADILQTAVIDAAAAEFVVRELLCVAGANITFDHLQALALCIAELVRDAACEGAVVIQGTDSLEETAFGFELLSDTQIPVVFTGAMRAPSQPGADGPANLAAAVRVVLASANQPGVYVVLNDEIHAARFVRKGHTSALDAFTSGDAGLVGRIHEGHVQRRMASLPDVRFGPLVPRAGAWPRVAIVKAGIGDSGDLLQALVGLGYGGCVVEAMGAGHVAEAIVPVLDSLARRIPVVLCSRAAAGAVFERTYGFAGSEIDLLGRGLLSGGALSGLKARVLLTVCLRARGASAGVRFGEICRLI